MDKKTIRFCAVMILFAIGLRLHAGGFFHQCLDVLTGPKVRAFLLYAGTGMVYVPPEQTTVPPETVPEETQPLPSFSPDDATLLHITNYPDYTLDVPAMLINERVFVPTRAVAETFGCDVTWNEAAQTVEIKSAETE